MLFYLQGVSLGSIQESFNSSREESLDCGEGESFADDDNHSNAAVRYSYPLCPILPGPSAVHKQFD